MVTTTAGKMKVTMGPYSCVPVASYKEASKVVCRDRDARGVGSSEWCGQGIGRILVDGVQVAFVSYNGRIWKGINDGKLSHDELVETSAT